jgi:hypothetical protein
VVHPSFPFFLFQLFVNYVVYCWGITLYFFPTYILLLFSKNKKFKKKKCFVIKILVSKFQLHEPDRRIEN